MHGNQPTPPAKTWTTHDAVTQRVTIEAPKNLIGDEQVYAGETYIFDGERWVLKK
jgi:hypothetical protein